MGAVVIYKVIKNDDSLEGAAKDTKGSIKGGFKGESSRYDDYFHIHWYTQ